MNKENSFNSNSNSFSESENNQENNSNNPSSFTISINQRGGMVLKDISIFFTTSKVLTTQIL